MALPLRETRTSTLRSRHWGTGATDQSEVPLVTTAPTWHAPSAYSMPALTQCSSSKRTKTPAWSNCSEKAAVNSTSTAESPGKAASRARSESWMKRRMT